MSDRKDRKPPPPVAGAGRDEAIGRGEAASDAAFDLWLQRGLHEMFDDVMREPIPDDLLRLIQQDRGGA